MLITVSSVFFVDQEKLLEQGEEKHKEYMQNVADNFSNNFHKLMKKEVEDDYTGIVKLEVNSVKHEDIPELLAEMASDMIEEKIKDMTEGESDDED